MKSLLLLPLLVLGTHAGPCYTEIYSADGQTGNSYYFETYAYELYSYGMDNDIDSVRQTGMWMYYENNFYNMEMPARVYYVHGIDIAVTFPAEYQNMASSLRHSGCSEALNADTIELYESTAFGGLRAVEETDAPYLYALSGNVSSILVIGSSPWTVYTGQDYTGSYWCLYNTDHDVGSNGTTLDLGLFPSIEDIGIPDNSIMSVRKGCYAARVAEAPKLQVDGRQKNGAWGRLL